MAIRDVQEYFETALEPFDVGGGALGVDWGAYVSPGSPYSVGSMLHPVIEPPRFVPTIVPIPEVLSGVALPSEDVSTGETAGDSALPEPEVIDPGYETTRTVYETVPGGIYETSREPTDWDRVYDEYVILNPEVEVGGIFDSVDWGEVAGTVMGGILDPVGLGNITQRLINGGGTYSTPDYSEITRPTQTGGVKMAANGPCTCCPGGSPKYAKICIATGVVTPLRRRRRRRLLTSSDIKDLSALKSIVGGAALQGAVVQAVRR